MSATRSPRRGHARAHPRGRAPRLHRGRFPRHERPVDRRRGGRVGRPDLPLLPQQGGALPRALHLGDACRARRAGGGHRPDRGPGRAPDRRHRLLLRRADRRDRRAPRAQALAAAPSDERIQAALRRRGDDLRGFSARFIRDAVNRGELDDATDVDEIAAATTMLLDGALIAFAEQGDALDRVAVRDRIVHTVVAASGLHLARR